MKLKTMKIWNIFIPCHCLIEKDPGCEFSDMRLVALSVRAATDGGIAVELL